MKVIKNAFLLILSMVLVSQTATAGFLNNQPSWTFGAFDAFSGYPSLSSVTIFSLGGDTLIGEFTYKKVLQNAHFAGAIREDGKKWYAVVPFLGPQPMLMYDFSANVGDTIRHYFGTQDFYFRSIVNSRDSITLENGERRLRMKVNYDQTWIEGIGDTQSFFNPVTPVTTCMLRCVGCIGSMEQLLCHKQDGAVLYSDATYASNGCSYKQGQSLDDILQAKGLNWLLTAEGMLDYRVFGPGSLVQNAKLLNLAGATVWEARSGFDGNGGRISVSHLPKGIYLLRVRTEGGLVVEKVSIGSR